VLYRSYRQANVGKRRQGGVQVRRWIAAASLAGYGLALIALRPVGGQWPRADAWAWLREDPERALLAITGCLGWLLAAWLFLATALALAGSSATAGGRLARRLAGLITPLALRRAVEIAVGAALAAGGPVSPAIAGPSPATIAGVERVALTPVPDPIIAAAEAPLPDLDRVGSATATPAASGAPPSMPSASHPPQPRASAPPSPRSPERASHRVAAGDTLWAIAADHLPHGASPAQITRAWQQWYLVNRVAVGSDPALLFPGELLFEPKPAS
jgi:hypothetical protein